MINKKKLLQYKKQIILQGPPGTGKTREAKLIAQNILLDNININSITNYINVGDSFPNASGTSDYYKIKTIDLLKKEVLLVSNKSKKEGNFAKFDKILERLKAIAENQTLVNTNAQHPYEIALAKFIFSNVCKSNEQFKLVQFHPSYTYEDFVRGIVAESKGESLEYKNINKTLGRFAEKAIINYKKSSQISQLTNYSIWVDEKFEDFKNEIEKEVEESEINLSGNINLFKVQNDNFRYGKDWLTPSRINFRDFKDLIKAVLENKLILSSQQIPKKFSTHAHYRSTYYNSLLKKFFDNYKYNGESYAEEMKNFVLVIDEINRANLPSVLGELIYALEYRGEVVESIYEVDGSQKLILPPNLYIIGTMNTADRSVGHIDYAIRRRFAFVDILPTELKDDDEIYFNTNGFNAISALFNETNVSKEFEIDSVQIGHSYFIVKKEDAKDIAKRDELFKMKIDYEVKPILLEYERDGILIGEYNNTPIREFIKAL